MLLHLLTVAFTAQDGPPNDCFSWCLPSLLEPTASAIPGVAPPASDEAAKRILGASAKSIGDVGEYLDCVRITNGTHEPIAAYALARFSLPLGGATASPTAGASQHYGCCVPKACGAEELERGFRVTLPSKLKSATETAAKTGAALDAIAAAIDGLPRNSSFSAAAAALRRDAATANKSHMPRAAAALSAAAQGAEQAAHADTALRAAAAAAAAQNKTAAAAALRAADELLRRGPGGGWMNALEKEREKLEAQAAALNASAAALAALSSAVSEMQFDVTVGSQRAGLGGAGWAWVVLAGALLALAAAGTAVDVAAQRSPPGGGKPPSPSGAEAHTRPLCAASCALSAPLAPTAVEPLRAPPPPGGENGGGGASLLPADDAEGGADLSNSSSRSSSPAQRMGACNIGPRGSGAFDFRDDSAPSARPPARQGSGGAASGGGRGEEPLGVAFLRCFSLVRNWRSLGSLRADGTMGCLDGMRCFSMAWVIFGHTIVYAMGGLRSPVGYQLVPAAFFAVDTFFWLSGLLTTHALLLSVRKAASAGKAWWSAYPMYALGRWMRLSPLVGVLLLTTVGLLPALGDGPMWSLGGAEGDACRAGGWWLNLLYVQNLFALAAPDSSLWRCEGHLWYLANDMQFFLAAPLFAYPLVTRPAVGWALLAAALTASTAANAIIAAVNGYAASPLFDQTYFTNVYIQPWTRAQPFLVGAAFAAFWDRLQGGAAPLARRHSPAGAASPARRADPAWLVWGLAAGAAAVMLALSFGTLGLYSALPSPWSEAQNVSYIALSRLGWPVGLSAVAYLCFSGQAPLVNGLLSWWPLQVFGKLTFAAYIVHPVVMYGVNYSTTAPIEFSEIWFAKSFTSFLAWASLLALLLWLLAEKPAANLLALALGRLGLKG